MRHHSFANWPTPAPAPAAPEPSPEPAPAPEPQDYSGLLKRELLALAEERGISVSSRDTKAEIITALEANDG